MKSYGRVYENVTKLGLLLQTGSHRPIFISKRVRLLDLET
jgi:hypothetical protein